MSSSLSETGEDQRDYNVNELSWAWTFSWLDSLQPFLMLGAGSGTVTIDTETYNTSMIGVGFGLFFNFGEWDLEWSNHARVFGYEREIIGITYGVNDTLSTTHIGLKFRF